ncbi:hypothetical protein K1719_016767 [Acacia pycnantha]|nr:hypothetical protein K1719_016767 [Acacia pycnantha]
MRHVLDDRAIEAILTIPIPRAPTDDRKRWLLSKNGVYSVKSGYFSLASAPTVITPTVTHLSSEIWKATWKVKTTPKVVNFLWRVLSDAVASNCALVKRKRGVSRGLLPHTTSSIKAPKANTSDLVVVLPVLMLSGAKYPRVPARCVVAASTQ